MKHPLKIFLQNIASRYRQISAHKVDKTQFFRQKFIILNFSENKVLKMKFLATKTVENQRF